MRMSRAGGVARLPLCRSPSSMRCALRVGVSRRCARACLIDVLRTDCKVPDASTPARPSRLCSQGGSSGQTAPRNGRHALPVTPALHAHAPRTAERPQQQKSAYNFPVERALRHLRRGRKHCRQREIGCMSVYRLPGETAEVCRFASYHCHHVIVRFKRDRARWNAAQQRQRRSVDAGTGRSSSSCLSATELAVVVHHLFSAAVLLHLTGLYHVCDKYVGRLVEVLFSGTVCLSMAYGTIDVKRAHAGSLDAPDDKLGMHRCSRAPPTLTLHWHSLHWAIVHYCEGVYLWRLLHDDDSRRLLPAERVKTRARRLRLVQLLAELVLRVAPDDITHVERRAIANLGRGLRAATKCVTKSSVRAAEGATCVTQDALLTRRLQLFPLLWVAMLLDRVMYASDTSTDRQAAQDVSYRTVRHALLRLMPLFAGAAHGDELVWLLLRRLYAPSCVVTQSAACATHCVVTAVELSALLSVMEKHNVHLRVLSVPRALYAADVLTWWLREGSSIAPLCAGDLPRIKHHHEVYSAILHIPHCTAITTVLPWHRSSDGATLRANVALNRVVVERLCFARGLVLQLLLQWRSPPRAAYRLPRRCNVTARDARRTELAVSYLVDELTHALAAAHHIEQLLSRLRSNTLPVTQAPQTLLDARDAFGCALQAGMRCLTWQLGHAILPQRMRLARDQHVPLVDVELRVLHELYRTARAVLLSSAGATQAGTVPECFTAQMQALLSPDDEQ